MHGLMSLWFGPLVELEADLGYFYLCPACHDEVIVPELERIQNRILELHPAAQRHLDEIQHQPGDDDLPPESEEDADPVAAAGEGSAEEGEVAGKKDGAGKKEGARKNEVAGKNEGAATQDPAAKADPGDESG